MGENKVGLDNKIQFNFYFEIMSSPLSPWVSPTAIVVLAFQANDVFWGEVLFLLCLRGFHPGLLLFLAFQANDVYLGVGYFFIYVIHAFTVGFSHGYCCFSLSS